MISSKFWRWIKRTASRYKNEEPSIQECLVNVEGNEPKTGLGYAIKQYLHPVLMPEARERSFISFTVQDGDFSIYCGMHNCDQEILADGIDDINDKYDQLHTAIRNGSRIKMTGIYRNFNRKRTFIVNQFEIDKTEKKSQMSEKHFDTFLEFCKNENTSPLQVMLDNLWDMFLAEDDLKKAIMLFCLSPEYKWDMLHIGIISSVGEGKDTIREHVIEPLVPSGFAGGRAVTTMPALVGAMSGDDIGTVNLGLLPKYNGERVVCTEFQTWDPDMFAGILSAMADGKVPINKGAVVGAWRNTVENLLFLGNPPRSWNPGQDRKMQTIECFGDNTPQMVSRITLLFSKLKLSNKRDEIKKLMAKNLDRQYTETKNQSDKLLIWQRFFRQYLRYVSTLPVEILPAYDALYESYKDISEKDEFKEIFWARMTEDNRKWQQWMVLCKSFAKLNGRTEISVQDIFEAKQVWMSSLATLADEFDLSMIGDDVDPFINRVQNYIRDLPDCTTQDLKEMKPGHIFTTTLIKSAIEKLKDRKKIFEISGHYFPTDSQYAQIRPDEECDINTWLDAYLIENPFTEISHIIEAAKKRWETIDENSLRDKINEANKRALGEEAD